MISSACHPEQSEGSSHARTVHAAGFLASLRMTGAGDWVTLNFRTPSEYSESVKHLG
jgi:hypothetical protein